MFIGLSTAATEAEPFCSCAALNSTVLVTLIAPGLMVRFEAPDTFQLNVTFVPGSIISGVELKLLITGLSCNGSAALAAVNAHSAMAAQRQIACSKADARPRIRFRPTLF
jgi:hypothetical protein